MRINHQPMLKRGYFLLKIILAVFLYSSSNTYLAAQENNFDKIVGAFQDYSKPYREIVYCHLNKSTYIKGESLGFSAYVLDKDLKIPSKTSKNLYCVITDSNDNIIKSKLVKVNSGFVNNVFNLDSLFTSGNYRFKAYTNWMKNFDEPNAFAEDFVVINPDDTTSIKKEVEENILDAQFLPEGGYFVDNVITNVGVIIKNTNGFGVSNVEGDVYDSNNQFIATFKTNSFGISKFLINPKINENYTVKINHLDQSFEFKIDAIKSKGVSVHINAVKDKLSLNFKTNQRTLQEIRGKGYKLTFHNGKDVKGLELIFSENNLVKILDIKELFSGVNIFTLFNENNTPILERMFFNYNGIKSLNSGDASYATLKDSITISMPLLKKFTSSIDSTNVSISVLSEETKSYNRHHSIISYVFMQPYVKSYIENAAYYFTDITPKKKYDLDNLLITQGWSSYSWENVFNNNIQDNFAFEKGIVLKGNQNNERQNDFILYPLKHNDGLVLNLSEDENSFVVSDLFPEGDEKLGLGTINKKGKVMTPNIYLQFFPSKIPDFNNEFRALLPKKTSISMSAVPKDAFTLINLKDIQELDEVLIKSDYKKTELRKFKESPFNDVDIFDDKKRARNLSFVNYVNQYLPYFTAIEQGGFISITNRMPTSLVNEFSSPVVYLDDLLLGSLDMLIGFNMNQVDYVAANRNGTGEGFIGANGVIRIYTSKEFKKNWKRTFKNFKIPLTFSENKKFYVPKYEVYNDKFFKEYGVIDWIPNCKIDNQGNLTFKVYNPSKNNIKIFIEGITSQGSYIVDTKVLNIEKD